jgi:hypothetical protein
MFNIKCVYKIWGPHGSSGVSWLKYTHISEEPTDDRGRTFTWSYGTFVPNYIPSHSFTQCVVVTIKSVWVLKTTCTKKGPLNFLSKLWISHQKGAVFVKTINTLIFVMKPATVCVKIADIWSWHWEVSQCMYYTVSRMKGSSICVIKVFTPQFMYAKCKLKIRTTKRGNASMEKVDKALAAVQWQNWAVYRARTEFGGGGAQPVSCPKHLGL